MEQLFRRGDINCLFVPAKRIKNGGIMGDIHLHTVGDRSSSAGTK